MMESRLLLYLFTDRKSQKTILSVLAVLLCLLLLLFFLLPVLITGIIISYIFPTDDLDTIRVLVASTDAAREEYIQEVVYDGYFQGIDPNGQAYRNTILLYNSGFSNNSQEIISAAACYYQQEWNTRDFTALCALMAVRSITFTTRESGPYSCAGCQTRSVCDGHTDADGEIYYHSDTSECSNPRTETSCPGNHYDLYVTASLVGWRLQSGIDRSAIRYYCLDHWEELTSLAHTDSPTINKYVDAFARTGIYPDWPGWQEEDLLWAESLYSVDWQELYGITILQVGMAGDGGSYDLTDTDIAFTGSGSLALPIHSYSYISCWFGDPDPSGTPHGGQDFAAGFGVPILAAADGIVVEARYHSSWGNYVKLYNGTIDGHEIYTLYAHASSLSVSAGQTVTQGQIIAAVGSTGFSTGNHLHFEVYVDGTTTRSRSDPAPWLGMSH